MELPEHLHTLAAETISCETDTAVRRGQFAIILGLQPKRDGNQWCVLWGENLQEGIAAFGDTPMDAIYNFDKAMFSKDGKV